MAEIIKWLNDNQGFVMSILTCVYVIATIIIVIYNRKSIKEMEKGRDEESRPYIFINLHKDPRDNWFYLRIKNYGKTGGKINSINVTPNLKFINDSEIEQFMKNTVLAPEQIIQFVVADKKEDIYENDYDVTIKYVSTCNNKKVYREQYKLITQYSTKMGYVDSKKSNFSDEANALNNIANYLDAIRNKL